jgi:hypothetical protein
VSTFESVHSNVIKKCKNAPTFGNFNFRSKNLFNLLLEESRSSFVLASSGALTTKLLATVKAHLRERFRRNRSHFMP